jgi:hypothetical protein
MSHKMEHCSLDLGGLTEEGIARLFFFFCNCSKAFIMLD